MQADYVDVHKLTTSYVLKRQAMPLDNTNHNASGKLIIDAMFPINTIDATASG